MRGIFKSPRKGVRYTGPIMTILITLVLLAFGLAVLIFGAEWLVRGASSIARRFGLSPLIVGLTIVAFGTSTPELTVSVYSALTGSTDIAIGNIIGSNIANILLILGISAMIVPLAVKSSTVKWEVPMALVAVLLVLAFGSDRLLDGGLADVLTRTDGLALLGFFAVFMFYIFALAKHDSAPSIEGEQTEGNPLSVLKSFGLVIAGLVALVFGGKLLVDQAVVLATLAGLSEAVIGLTVVAVGTSLPELATSVIAAMKKEVDIAVGNVVGSNIFNVFWILGLTSVIAPLPVSPSFVIDSLVAVAATTALFLAVFVGTRGRIDRWQGIAFVVAYIGYTAYLVI